MLSDDQPVGRSRAGAPSPSGRWPSPDPRPEDLDRPSSARVNDFMLGGAVNGAVDRDLGRELIRFDPVAVAMARESRGFLRRAVTFLVGAGITQFLDLGSGIPSMGNVHEVARRADPDARVAYVDLDPVATGHGRSLLAGAEGLSVTEADLRDVDSVLAAAVGTLDLSRPVGLCLFSVLQHVPDADDPAAIVRRYLDALAPGSAIALSHVTADDPRVDVEGLSRLTGAYARGAITPRPRAAVSALLAGVDLVEPGLTWAALWRPERPPVAGELICGHHAAVGLTPCSPA